MANQLTIDERIALIQKEIDEANDILDSLGDNEDGQGDSSSETPEYWEGKIDGLEHALDILIRIR